MTHDAPDAPDVVEVEVRIAARPETIFAFLTDEERYVRWQGTAARLDPRPGGIYRVSMPNGDVASGHYVVVEPPRRVVFTWGWEGNDTLVPGQSTVEIILTVDGEATVVRLRHTGLPSDEWRDLHTAGWQEYLGRLAAVGADAEIDRTGVREK